MTASQRPGRSALDEFLPELDVRRESRHSRVDPCEIHLEPIAFRPELVEAPRAPIEPAEAPLAPIVVERSKRAQLWPMLAAALVGIGVTILAFVAFSQFAH